VDLATGELAPEGKPDARSYDQRSARNEPGTSRVAPPNNAGIGKVTTSRERPFIVESALHAQGMERRAAVSVSFGDLRVGRETVAFRGNGAVTVKMEIAGQSGPGGCVRLETDDPFQLDNIRYFVLGEGGRRRVVIVGDSTQSYPIAAALRAIGESQWSPVILRTPGDLSMSDIDSADMVVLNEVPFVPRPITILRTARFFAPKAIIVSPKTRPTPSKTAAKIPGVAAGSVTKTAVCHLEAPRARLASRISRGMVRMDSSTAWTISTTWATLFMKGL